ncbi:tetratricopeptide repeat protein, partial [Teladorsagia circumcincta]
MTKKIDESAGNAEKPDGNELKFSLLLVLALAFDEGLPSGHRVGSLIVISNYESLEDTAQAIELYSQANSLAPSDPAILARLAAIYDAEGDKTQAFQSNYDSYRYYPSNLKVIEWMGAYYIDAQFSEKAVNYFEKASIMQPNEIKWQLMMASSHRRAGNYQKALELYKNIHKKFPANIECLKFLVRITTDLGMPEAKEYVEKLGKAER